VKQALGDLVHGSGGPGIAEKNKDAVPGTARINGQMRALEELLPVGHIIGLVQKTHFGWLATRNSVSAANERQG